MYLWDYNKNVLNKIWSIRSFIQAPVKRKRSGFFLGQATMRSFISCMIDRAVTNKKPEGCTTFAIHIRDYVTGSAAGSTSSLRDVIIRRAIGVRVRWRGRKLHGVRARTRLHELVVVITESRGGLLSIAFVYRSIGRSPSRRPAMSPVRASKPMSCEHRVSIIISNYVTFCTVIRTLSDERERCGSVERITS